jgi:hypothetical protein
MTHPDDEPDEDAPAARPEDFGEDANAPSATHGDPHNRPPLDLR